jgi:hypothetical protein
MIAHPIKATPRRRLRRRGAAIRRKRLADWFDILYLMLIRHG